MKLVQSHKPPLDQYYTPMDIAKKCCSKVVEVLNQQGIQIQHVIEPSAGTGSFSQLLSEYFKGSDIIALDIDPKEESILTQDFLTFKAEYRANTLVIGNPPYGEKLKMAKAFYNKSIDLADVIAFILPISQLNKHYSFYQFDLLASEDLGEVTFSEERKVKCCFNIYMRPSNGLNPPVKPLRLKDVTFVRQDSKRYENASYDLRMCYWGNGSVGKILDDNEHYSAEYKVQIHNQALRSQILDVLKTVDWKKEYQFTAMAKLQQYHICETLKKYIPEIQ